MTKLQTRKGIKIVKRFLDVVDEQLLELTHDNNNVHLSKARIDILGAIRAIREYLIETE